MKIATDTRARRLLGAVVALSMTLILSGVPANASSGPTLVKNINPGFADSTPRWLTNMDGILYFSAKGATKGRELWRSDGTSSGTYRVKDIRAGAKGSDPMALSVAGGLLYFSANDGANGRELWVTDGSGAGTRLVKDVNPGSGGADPRGFTGSNGIVYFSADDGSSGRELWRTDGTTAGTRRVKDLTVGPDSTNPESLTAVAGKLVFLGACPTGASCTYYGTQTLYRTDGTASGTKPLRDVDGGFISGAIWSLKSIGGRAYFGYLPDDSDTTALWTSKGTAASTRKIADFGPNAMTDVGGTAFIAANGLWKSDGTAATTTPIKDIPVFSAFLFAGVGGRLFFDSESDDWFHALWVSDGTPDGTQPLVSAFTLTQEWAALGPTLYFANQVDDGYTLWRSDGTPTGTYGVGGQEARMWDVTAVGNSIFWVSDAGDHGNELWRYVP